jgi:hypothetical protein
MVLDVSRDQERDSAENQPGGQPAGRRGDNAQSGPARVKAGALDDHAQDDCENHNSGAVVEWRLAVDENLEIVGHLALAKKGRHAHRAGRCDHGAEEHGDHRAADAAHPVEGAADDECGKDDTGHGKGDDRLEVLQQPIKTRMHGPWKSSGGSITRSMSSFPKPNCSTLGPRLSSAINRPTTVSAMV